jgi:hypothetical protein
MTGRAFAKFANPQIVVTAAPKEKGRAPVSARPKNQDLTMLSVLEQPAKGKAKTVAPQKFHTVSDMRKAQLWLDTTVAETGTNVTARVVSMTPELAAVLLGRNEGNRKVKQRRVDDIARDIMAGSWKLNGEPIIVSSEGKLNDGQHRCAAVIQSKMPTDMLVVFGVSGDSRDTVDHGVGRSPGDDLALHGHANGVQLAATARMVWRWRTYGELLRSGNRTPTRMELMRVVEENPGLNRSLLMVGSKGPRAKAIASIATLAFCHFAFKTVAAETEVARFFDALIDGADLQRGDPILNARNRLIAERNQLTQEMKAELLFRSWNAFRLEQTRVLFRITGGELPLLEA